MKKVLWMIGGFCAAAAGFLVWDSRRTPSVQLLEDRAEAVVEEQPLSAEPN